VTAQLAVPAVPAASVQLVAENEPAPLLLKATDPVGVTLVPALESVTVALHELVCPTAVVEGAQLIAVDVLRWVTVSVVDVPPLARCALSPG
jgi:hypothetical protein